MTVRKIVSIAAVALTLGAAACAPVFHAGDYAGLTPVAPVGAPASTPVVAQR